MTVSALIQCECAFTYMNASSGRNLSEVLMVNVNGAWARVRDRAAGVENLGTPTVVKPFRAGRR